MLFLARRIVVFGKDNTFKDYIFKSTKKAQRFWMKCKRKGLDAQCIY